MSRVISVNVSQPREVEFRGHLVSTGIYKLPVEGPVRVEGVNLEGDDQADRRVHGGVHKAIYAYASEDYEWWGQQIGCSLSPGMFGENLTTAEVEVSGAVIGQRWQIGDVVLEVSEPRVPCFKLGIRMEDPDFPAVFAAGNRPGSYLRIVEEGSLAAQDRIQIGKAPDHGLTVADVARIFDRDRHEASRLLEPPQLSEPWKRWARKFV